MNKIESIIPAEAIERKIYLIRGQKVILSMHLAELYGVETRVLNQAVKRNIERFPKDFMFKLTGNEFENLKSQVVISSWGGLRRGTPYAFTENGVAMLSSVLKSKRAIQVNIQIMRTFTRLREILLSHKELQRKIEEMEKKYDSQFEIVFDTINQLLTPQEPKKRKIGFGRE